MKRALVALLLAGAPGPAQTGDVFAGIPGVTFTYYPVAGQDAAALRRAIDGARLTDGNDHQPVDALSHWTMRWRWRVDGRGGCDLASATVTFSAEVTLPQLADPDALSPALLAQWRRYLAALETHEAGHVRYAYEHRGDVLAAIKAATCTTATQAGDEAIEAIKAHELAYDRDTQHGRAQGATFPGAEIGSQ